eukprot:4505096-Amphidinium_carterae.1
MHQVIYFHSNAEDCNIATCVVEHACEHLQKSAVEIGTSSESVKDACWWCRRVAALDSYVLPRILGAAMNSAPLCSNSC